jgi:hypothetical protein
MPKVSDSFVAVETVGVRLLYFSSFSPARPFLLLDQVNPRQMIQYLAPINTTKGFRFCGFEDHTLTGCYDKGAVYAGAAMLCLEAYRENYCSYNMTLSLLLTLDNILSTRLT